MRKPEHDPEPKAARDKRKRTRRMRGILARTGFSTEAHMAEKRRDAERENRSMAGDAGG